MSATVAPSGWVAPSSGDGPTLLSLLLALARDLHTFLLDALKEYKKRTNSLLKVSLARLKEAH